MGSYQYKEKHFSMLSIIAAAFVIVTMFIPPIPQPHDYFRFADSRTLLGIPNFSDVISNLFLLFAGAWGLQVIYKPFGKEPEFEESRESYAYTLFFAGAALTCFGSIWFHLSPDNSTLVWDRLPITVIVAALLSIVLSEHINTRIGSELLPLFIVLGIGSVIYWAQTEAAGHGDLRPYILTQSLPAILITYMLLMLPSRYSREERFGWLMALYVASRAAEYFDRIIFEFTMQWISGHTIKHLLSAAAIAMIADMLRHRIPVDKFKNVKFASDNY